MWDKALSKGDHEGIEYDASLEKSDDELNLKGTKEWRTRGGRKLETKKLTLLATRDKRSKKDMGTQKESQTPCVTNKQDFLELAGATHCIKNKVTGLFQMIVSTKKKKGRKREKICQPQSFFSFLMESLDNVSKIFVRFWDHLYLISNW